MYDLTAVSRASCPVLMLSSMPAASPVHLHISLTITLQCRTKYPVSNVRTERVSKLEHLVQGQVVGEPGLSPQESHQRPLFIYPGMSLHTRRSCQGYLRDQQ